MIYNGFDFSPYFVDEDIREPILPSMKHDVREVPGADGGVFGGITFGTRSIEVDIRIIRENRQALNELLPFIAAKLNGSKPSRLYTRLHSGEYYMAMLSDIGDIEKWYGTGSTTLTFTAYDPARYVDGERAVPLSYASRDAVVLGSYPAKPVIEVSIPTACSYVAVSDLTTGQQIRSEAAFKAGNRVVFDCTSGADTMKTALLYATASSTTATKLPITPQSRWFELQPGVHTMRLLAASSSVAGTLRYVERRL